MESWACDKEGLEVCTGGLPSVDKRERMEEKEERYLRDSYQMHEYGG